MEDNALDYWRRKCSLCAFRTLPLAQGHVIATISGLARCRIDCSSVRGTHLLTLGQRGRGNQGQWC